MAQKRKSKGLIQKKNPISNFVIEGKSLNDCMTFIILESSEIDQEQLCRIYESAILGAMAITIIAQLKYSTTEPSQYVDGLPSVRNYKKQMLNGLGGRVWTTLIACSECYHKAVPDHLSEEPSMTAIEFVLAYINIPVNPCKRVNGPPNKNNWQDWLFYRRTVLLGKMMSCPTTKPSYFGFDSSCTGLDLPKTIDFITSNDEHELLERCLDELHEGTNLEDLSAFYNDIQIDFADYMTGVYDADDVLPASKLKFEEADSVKSILEKELLPTLSRTGTVSLKTARDGSLPSNALTKQQLEENLKPAELRRYKVALEQGDKSYLKELNKLAATRLKNKANNPLDELGASGATEPPAVSDFPAPPGAKKKRRSIGKTDSPDPPLDK